MRKLFLFMMVSVDGYFEGPNHELDWHNANSDEFNKYVLSQLNEVDTILFGRTTYQMMSSYWPSAITDSSGVIETKGMKFAVHTQASDDHNEIARLMNDLKKIVFSRELDKVAEWKNSRLVKGDALKEVAKLKRQAGKDIVIIGSSNLSASLLKAGLIDEIRVMVNPIVLGEGKSLFNGMNQRVKLKLAKTKQFNDGNILLYYNPTNTRAVD